MSSKRPPSIAPRLPRSEWRPEDTQTLERRIDLAQETEWRRSVVDQLTNMAKTLGDVRDTARAAEAGHEHKASKSELSELAGKVAVVANSIFWLRLITAGVLLTFVVETLAEFRGHK